MWLEAVAAVEDLTDTHRPRLTLWDALDQAIRWWTAELLDPATGSPPDEPSGGPGLIPTRCAQASKRSSPQSFPPNQQVPLHSATC